METLETGSKIEGPEVKGLDILLLSSFTKNPNNTSNSLDCVFFSNLITDDGAFWY